MGRQAFLLHPSISPPSTLVDNILSSSKINSDYPAKLRLPFLPITPVMAEQQELKTYRGNCHCGAYIYEVKLPEIKTASDCNCSHCSKKGLVWQYPKPSDLTWVKGDPETLTDYRFGSKGFGHKVSRIQTC